MLKCDETFFPMEMSGDGITRETKVVSPDTVHGGLDGGLVSLTLFTAAPAAAKKADARAEAERAAAERAAAERAAAERAAAERAAARAEAGFICPQETEGGVTPPISPTAQSAQQGLLNEWLTAYKAQQQEQKQKEQQQKQKEQQQKQKEQQQKQKEQQQKQKEQQQQQEQKQVSYTRR